MVTPSGSPATVGWWAVRSQTSSASESTRQASRVRCFGSPGPNPTMTIPIDTSHM